MEYQVQAQEERNRSRVRDAERRKFCSLTHAVLFMEKDEMMLNTV